MNVEYDPATLYRAIGEATSDAIIFAGRDGIIRLWNRGAELIFGYPAAEAIGQSLDLIIPERLRRAHWDAFDRSMEAGQTKYTDRVLTTRSMRKDGTTLYVDLTFAIILDHHGAALGALAQARDVTERYERERAQRAQARAQEQAGQRTTSSS